LSRDLEFLLSMPFLIYSWGCSFRSYFRNNFFFFSRLLKRIALRWRMIKFVRLYSLVIVSFIFSFVWCTSLMDDRRTRRRRATTLRGRAMPAVVSTMIASSGFSMMFVWSIFLSTAMVIVFIGVFLLLNCFSWPSIMRISSSQKIVPPWLVLSALVAPLVSTVIVLKFFVFVLMLAILSWSWAWLFVPLFILAVFMVSIIPLSRVTATVGSFGVMATVFVLGGHL